MAIGKASIRDRFTKTVDKLRETAENHGKADKLEEQRKWTQLDLNGWDGDLTDIEGMSKPFDRQEIAQDAKDAVKDSENPGNVGDLTLTSLQGDWLATLERAYRNRHAGSVRLRSHAAARKVAQGHEAGVFAAGVKGYLEVIEQLSKNETSNG